jgi:uncharacterized membrane protein
MSNTSPTPSPSSTKNTTMAAIAYVLFFIPLLTDSKDDPFVKFHVKQSLVLLILSIFTSILSGIPYIGIIGWVLGLGIFVLWVIGIMNALNGSMTPVPLVGKYAEEYLKF